MSGGVRRLLLFVSQGAGGFTTPCSLSHFWVSAHVDAGVEDDGRWCWRFLDAAHGTHQPPGQNEANQDSGGELLAAVPRTVQPLHGLTSERVFFVRHAPTKINPALNLHSRFVCIISPIFRHRLSHKCHRRSTCTLDLFVFSTRF